MQRLEVSGAVRPIYGSLGVKRLRNIFVLTTNYAAALQAVFFLQIFQPGSFLHLSPLPHVPHALPTLIGLYFITKYLLKKNKQISKLPVTSHSWVLDICLFSKNSDLDFPFDSWPFSTLRYYAKMGHDRYLPLTLRIRVIIVSLARHHPHRTHDLRSGSQDHHPSTNSVQKTICCNSTSNPPDDGRMYPKHVELRIHQ